MGRRIQTCFTFSSESKAVKFANWLKRNQGDSEYGTPRFIDMRSVDMAGSFCVEYESQDDKFVSGVAVGCNQN